MTTIQSLVIRQRFTITERDKNSSRKRVSIYTFQLDVNKDFSWYITGDVFEDEKYKILNIGQVLFQIAKRQTITIEVQFRKNQTIKFKIRNYTLDR